MQTYNRNLPINERIGGLELTQDMPE